MENAIGAHLLNHLTGINYEVYYWRLKGLETDFVIKTPRQLWGIEVKSGSTKNVKGLTAFLKAYPDAKIMIVGADGIPLEEFFRYNPADIF